MRCSPHAPGFSRSNQHSDERYLNNYDSDDRYLNISLVNNNKEVINKFTEVWKGIKDQILKINGSVKEYDKDYREIKFGSDVSLPLNTPLNLLLFDVLLEKMVNVIQEFTLMMLFVNYKC